MDCISFQFLNQDYAKILHKNDYFFPRDPKMVWDLFLYILSNCAFLLVYLNFGYIKTRDIWCKNEYLKCYAMFTLIKYFALPCLDLFMSNIRILCCIEKKYVWKKNYSKSSFYFNKLTWYVYLSTNLLKGPLLLLPSYSIAEKDWV